MHVCGVCVRERGGRGRGGGESEREVLQVKCLYNSAYTLAWPEQALGWFH